MTHEAQTRPRRLHAPLGGHAPQGRWPAGGTRREEGEIDEADACELGSLAALEHLRREREAERG